MREAVDIIKVDIWLSMGHKNKFMPKGTSTVGWTRPKVKEGQGWVRT